MTEALQDASEKLKAITAGAGPGAVACAGGRRSSLETQHALVELCEANGWRGPSFFPHRRQSGPIKSAVGRLENGLAVSLRQVEAADFILAVCADPVNEAPMLALAMRQAQRKGAGIAVLDPRPISLPVQFEHLKALPNDVDRCLGAILKESVEKTQLQQLGENGLAYYKSLPAGTDGGQPYQKQVEDIARRLRKARRPIIVCGTEVSNEVTPAMAADGVLLLQAVSKAAGLFYLMPGANAFGAALLEKQSFDETLSQIESGTVRALILVEWDALRWYPDRSKLDRVLKMLDLLIVLDYLDSNIGRQADALLPTTTVYESGGFYINQEGRIQEARSAYRGGPSILQAGRGGHPPRIYSCGIPGADLWPAWRIAAALKENQDDPKFNAHLSERPMDRLLADIGLPSGTPIPEEGIRVLPASDASRHFQIFEPQASDGVKPGLELLAVEWTFGTEELSVTSPPLNQIEAPPCLTMHSEDASKLNIQGGDKVKIKTDLGELTAPVCLNDGMARGILVLPRHHQLNWQILGPGQYHIQESRITKVSE